MKTNIEDRISLLRKEMRKNGIDAYIIPTADPHLSEYPADCWKYREWISGFTGSAGTIVLTDSKGGLWTDSRYFLQADEQLEDSGIDLYKLKTSSSPSIAEFLKEELNENSNVLIYGETMSISEFKSLEKDLASHNINIISNLNLVSSIWEDRPSLPEAPIFEMPLELSGKSTEDKIAEINDRLKINGADCTILSSLDEVAWTFNIRGTDVKYNPVAIAYGFISKDESVLFINPKKLSKELSDTLKREGVKIADYSMINHYISRLSPQIKIFIDPDRTNISIYNSIPKECRVTEGLSIPTQLKSIKSETEIKGFKNAVVKDGVALTKFFYWLEEKMSKGESVTELSASAKLSSLRTEQPLYVMDSFESISSYGPHGAIVHYTPTPDTDTELKPDNLYLLDSGAQYMDGTTDVTRTIALCKNPTDQMKKDFTRALKGTIDLAKCKFPAGIRGCLLDVLARKPLWDAGINYLHGTCHGIGHCLNVHEGPQSIRMEENPVILQPGMVMSDEPAMYRPGQYGIRTENIMVIREDSETEFGKFLNFETLTLCYIDTNLIIPSMLSAREHAWLNKYHQNVFDTLSPHLNEDEKHWLRLKTAEI